MQQVFSGESFMTNSHPSMGFPDNEKPIVLQKLATISSLLTNNVCINFQCRKSSALCTLCKKSKRASDFIVWIWTWGACILWIQICRSVLTVIAILALHYTNITHNILCMSLMLQSFLVNNVHGTQGECFLRTTCMSKKINWPGNSVSWGSVLPGPQKSFLCQRFVYTRGNSQRFPGMDEYKHSSGPAVSWHTPLDSWKLRGERRSLQ